MNVTTDEYTRYKYLLDALSYCDISVPLEKGFQFLKGLDTVLFETNPQYINKHRMATPAYFNKVSELLRLPYARFFYDKKDEHNQDEWSEFKLHLKLFGTLLMPSSVNREPLVKIMYTRKRPAKVLGMKLPSKVSGVFGESQPVIELDDKVGRRAMWVHYPSSEGNLMVQKVQSKADLKIDLNFYPEPLSIENRKLPDIVLDRSTKIRITHNFKCVIFGGALHCDVSQGGHLCRVFMPSVIYDRTSLRGGGLGKKSILKKNSKKIRKHQGIYQRGPKKGRLKPGFKYSGKKTKTGLKIIIRVKKK